MLEPSFKYIKYALQNLPEVFTNLDIPIIGNSKKELVGFLKQQKFSVIKKLMRNNIFVEKVKEKLAINDIIYITKGTEGEIYKTTIQDGENEKDIIILKRRHDNNIDHEFDMQKRACLLNNGHEENAYIPEIFGKTAIDGVNYIIMEYIDGKTLYTLMLENMIEKLYIDLLKKDPIVDSVIQQYITSGKAYFTNDTEAETAIMNILVNIAQYYPTYLVPYNIQLDPHASQKEKEEALRKLYGKFKYSLFSQKEKFNINKRIGNTLQKLHIQGFYHRDGANPRNIMFIDNQMPVLIDFGRSVYNKEFIGNKEYEKGYGPYADSSTNHLENSGYEPDSYIMNLISSCSYKDEDIEEFKEEAERKNLSNTCYDYCKKHLDKMREQFGWTIHDMPVIIGKAYGNNGLINYIEESIQVGGTKKPWRQDLYKPIDFREGRVYTTESAEKKIIKEICSLSKPLFDKTYIEICTLLGEAKGKKKKAYYSFIKDIMDFCKQGFTN